MKSFFSLFFLVLTASLSAWPDCRLKVIDDNATPVCSRIIRIQPDGTETEIGKTDSDGILVLSPDCCNKGDVLMALPGNGAWKPGKVSCQRIQSSTSLTLLVTKTTFLNNLESNAKALEEKEKYARAAMLYNEIFSRARDFNPELSSWAQNKVFETFGSFLDQEKLYVFDPVQDRKVMSPSFRQAIQDFQKKVGVKETGRLDMPTFRAATGGDKVVRYLFRNMSQCEDL
jgi:hypothetical protein